MARTFYFALHVFQVSTAGATKTEALSLAGCFRTKFNFCMIYSDRADGKRNKKPFIVRNFFLAPAGIGFAPRMRKTLI
jgi:hypothetical protein